MIKLDTSLDVKITGGVEKDVQNVEYRVIPEGEYLATLERVYKWKSIKKDTKVAKRNDDGEVIKDANGNVVKVEVKDLEWYNTDIILRVKGGAYDGVAIKGSLSTHPEMKRALSNFLYSAGLFNVPVGDIYNHIGAEVGVVTQNKTRSYVDKETGFDKSVTDVRAYYYKKPSQLEAKDDFGL